MNSDGFFESELEVTEDIEAGENHYWIKDTPGARLYKEVFASVFGDEVFTCPLWGLKIPGKGSFFCYVLHSRKTLLVPPGALSINRKYLQTGLGTQVQHILEKAVEVTGYNLVCAITKKEEKLGEMLRMNGYYEHPTQRGGLTYYIHRNSPRIIEGDAYAPDIVKSVGIYKAQVSQLHEPLEGQRRGYSVRVKEIITPHTPKIKKKGKTS